MKCSEYYGVQFAQGQYVMHWEAAAYDGIVDKLFAREEPISVSYEGLGEAAGAWEVRAFFRKIGEMAKKNGGLLRLDLPATQKITVEPDGRHAIGEWETMTYRVMGAAFGNDLKQAPLGYAIGRYCNRFALEDGVWKLAGIQWRPVMEFGDWKTRDATEIYKQPYPKPFEELSAVDDSTASQRAVANCNVRNHVMEIFHDYNRVGISAIDGRFQEDAARCACRMLETPWGIGGYQGTVLATSPIVAMEPHRARIYLNIGRILPVSDTQVAHSRGRICGELLLSGGAWKFSEFRWYRYATMEPWVVRKV